MRDILCLWRASGTNAIQHIRWHGPGHIHVALHSMGWEKHYPTHTEVPENSKTCSSWMDQWFFLLPTGQTSILILFCRVPLIEFVCRTANFPNILLISIIFLRYHITTKQTVGQSANHVWQIGPSCFVQCFQTNTVNLFTEVPHHCTNLLFNQ